MNIHPHAPRDTAGPQHRLCLAADVEQYSRLDTLAQSVVQADLVRVLDEAAGLAGLHRADWARQPQGDQEFAVLPAHTRQDIVLGSFVRHLAARLAAVNARRTTRLRVRLAVDSGVVADAALGHAGPAPVAVARYLNAPQTKSVLAALASTDLVMIVSDRLYQDVVRLGQPGLDPRQYVKVHVEVKEFGGYGWLHVPGHGPERLRPLVAGPGREPSPDTPATDGTSRTAVSQSPTTASQSRTTVSERPATVSQHIHGDGVAVGGDVTGGVTVGLPPAPRSGGPHHAR
ncbi:hypothetical protein AB0L75_00030 [Streptomyces sp. NPDC052101]|uniref:hypothetical protein n=1 Tax=Streptomyces sp. NPDC052101 TaxID=3155763 RepID=UPI0034318869